MAKAGILGTVQTTPTNTADVEVYKVPTTGVSFAVVDIHVSAGAAVWLKTTDGKMGRLQAEIFTPPYTLSGEHFEPTVGRIVRKVVLGPGESVMTKTDTSIGTGGGCLVYGIEHV